MKKILLTTSILAVSATAAAADVKFFGEGRVGLAYRENLNDKTYIEQEFQFHIVASTETTSGWLLTGHFKLQADDKNQMGPDDRGNIAKGEGPSAAIFSANYGGFRAEGGLAFNVLTSHEVVNWGGHKAGVLDMPDQRQNMIGALDVMAIGYPGVAGIDAPQSVRLRQRFDNGVLVTASYTPDNYLLQEYYQIGASYSSENHRIGLLHGSNTDHGDSWVLGADGRFGKLHYSSLVVESDRNRKTAYGGSLKYELTETTSVTGVMSLHGDTKQGLFAGAEDIYALGFTHSLGGGVSVGGAIGKASTQGTAADFGVQFYF